MQKDEDIARVFDAVRETYGRLDFLIHSIAFAPPHELRNPYLEMSRAGWHLAMDISVYSLVAVSRAAAPLMTDGGAIVTISYFGGEKVMPGYNADGRLQGRARAQRPLPGLGLGPQENPRQRDHAGPMRTLSSAGIAGFDKMRDHAAEKSPLGRNVDPEELGTHGPLPLGPLSGGLTGETLHVDCGYSIIGL